MSKYMDEVVETAKDMIEAEKFNDNVYEYIKLYKERKKAKLEYIKCNNRLDLFLAQKQYFSEGDTMESSALNCIILEMNEDLK